MKEELQQVRSHPAYKSPEAMERLGDEGRVGILVLSISIAALLNDTDAVLAGLTSGSDWLDWRKKRREAVDLATTSYPVV